MSTDFGFRFDLAEPILYKITLPFLCNTAILKPEGDAGNNLPALKEYLASNGLQIPVH